MNAVIYTRFSSDMQDTNSTLAQARACKEYAERNNMKIVKIYSDEAYSGTNDNRPQFQQMIKDSKLMQFDAIIVHKLDRFSRDRNNSTTYRAILKKNGVDIISVLEPLDNSPESIILMSVLEGMAEYYSKNLSREVKKGQKEIALKGKWTGGVPALGFDINEHKMHIINEQEAQTIRLIFKLYSEGFGYSHIIDELNRLEYKTKNNKTFSKGSLYSILTNEKYKGTYVFNKIATRENGKRNAHKSKPLDEIIKIENMIPSIVADDIWNKVYDRMKSNMKSTFKAKEVYLLSGILFCKECGAGIIGSRKSVRNEHIGYYICSNRKNKRTCDAPSIRKDEIETQILDKVTNDIFSPSKIDEWCIKINTFNLKKLKESHNDKELIGKELSKTEKEIEKIINAILKDIPVESLKDKLQELENKKKTLKNKLSELEIYLEFDLPSLDKVRHFLNNIYTIRSLEPEQQKTLIKQYIGRIELDKKKDVFLTVDTTKAEPSAPKINKEGYRDFSVVFYFVKICILLT